VRGARRSALLLTALTTALLSPATVLAAGLDVRGWLDRPDVRLVAVEFYATWCKPCMEAVPLWERLRRRYWDRGLRLIVVATQDPEGQCDSPGWTPDEIVCDPDGSIARAYHVHRLPAAFLWSWQGNLLVRRGHVAEVERVAEQYLRALPRVLVQATDDRQRPSRALAALLRAELTRTGRIDVVATDKERADLRRIRRDSHGMAYDDRLACEPGQEVPANSLLRAAVVEEGRRRYLSLTLLDAVKGCAPAVAYVPWHKKRPVESVAAGVADLLSRLRHAPDLPPVARAAEQARRPPAALAGPPRKTPHRLPDPPRAPPAPADGPAYVAPAPPEPEVEIDRRLDGGEDAPADRRRKVLLSVALGAGAAWIAGGPVREFPETDVDSGIGDTAFHVLGELGYLLEEDLAVLLSGRFQFLISPEQTRMILAPSLRARYFPSTRTAFRKFVGFGAGYCGLAGSGACVESRVPLHDQDYVDTAPKGPWLVSADSGFLYGRGPVTFELKAALHLPFPAMAVVLDLNVGASVRF